MKKNPFIQQGWLILMILLLPLFVFAQPGRGAQSGPSRELPAELNLLNLFYAIEWVIFGGFAPTAISERAMDGVANLIDD